MPKYIIERELPGAGQLRPAELKGISLKSRCILGEMGSQIQWVESYLTANKLYCVYIANSEAAVREHARKGDFPVNSVAEIRRMIDPTTAETCI